MTESTLTVSLSKICHALQVSLTQMCSFSLTALHDESHFKLMSMHSALNSKKILRYFLISFKCRRFSEETEMF